MNPLNYSECSSLINRMRCSSYNFESFFHNGYYEYFKYMHETEEELKDILINGFNSEISLTYTSTTAHRFLKRFRPDNKVQEDLYVCFGKDHFVGESTNIQNKVDELTCTELLDETNPNFYFRECNGLYNDCIPFLSACSAGNICRDGLVVDLLEIKTPLFLKTHSFEQWFRSGRARFKGISRLIKNGQSEYHLSTRSSIYLQLQIAMLVGNFNRIILLIYGKYNKNLYRDYRQKNQYNMGRRLYYLWRSYINRVVSYLINF